MSTRHLTPDTTTRTFHPRALAALGTPACIAMLSVARDLRSGVIPPEHYAQNRSCGTPCCIYGHVINRIGKRDIDILNNAWSPDKSNGLMNLFAAWSNCTTERAARAIERYLYEGAEQPWRGLV